uniref:Bravo_FIGEY domain-containing protein n=1 Tax=Parastrongyloides trichosuri TaxID=131310 RepID=A0A0N4ZGN8_PARTI
MSWKFTIFFIHITLLGLVKDNVGSEVVSIPIKFKLISKEGNQEKKSINFEDVPATEENIIREPFTYKNKVFKNIKVIRLDIDVLDNDFGVYVKLDKLNPDYPDKYLTHYDGGDNLNSERISDKRFNCDESTCGNGIVVISNTKLTDLSDLEDEKNAFFLLFVHKDMYSLRVIKTVEKANKLIRCPYKGVWMEEIGLLKYEHLNAYPPEKTILGNHLLVPAQKTQLNKNTMVCGNLYFKGVKVFSIGYNLEFVSDTFSKAEIDIDVDTIDCREAKPFSDVQVASFYTKFKYIPIESSFDDVQRNFVEDITSSDGSMLLLYNTKDIDKLNTKHFYAIGPVCTVIYKGYSKIDFQVNFIAQGKELKEKDFSIDSKKETVKIYEIDLNDDNLSDREVLIKKTECIIHQKGQNSKLDNYYTYKYKPKFIKKSYDGTKSVHLSGNKPVNMFESIIPINDFTMFGLYQCVSVDRSGEIRSPPDTQQPFKYFAILPKPNSIVQVPLEVSYEKDLQGKGKCPVEREGFGKLEQFSFYKDNNQIFEGKILDLEYQNQYFEYNAGKTEVLYKGKIVLHNKLTCTYKTNYQLSFSVRILFAPKTDKEKNIIVGGDGNDDNTSVIVASVVSVGVIGIAVVIAFVLLRRHRKKKRRRHGKTRADSKMSTSKTGTSTGFSRLKLSTQLSSISKSQNADRLQDVKTKETVRISAR